MPTCPNGKFGVNDSYPYPVLCIRSNDGTHRDRRWVNNYDWCLRNADSGRLTFFIVYFVWRTNWQAAVDTFKDQVRTPHPKMAVMLDVVAHQYTDGQGYGGGLPEGASPFGRCDMNSADGLTAEEFARACGIAPTESVPTHVANSRIRRKFRFE
jgi:hypothetical protein